MVPACLGDIHRLLADIQNRRPWSCPWRLCGCPRTAPPHPGGAVDDPVTGPEYLLDLAAREDPEWSDLSAYTVGF